MADPTLSFSAPCDRTSYSPIVLPACSLTRYTSLLAETWASTIRKLNSEDPRLCGPFNSVAVLIQLQSIFFGERHVHSVPPMTLVSGAPGFCSFSSSPSTHCRLLTMWSFIHQTEYNMHKVYQISQGKLVRAIALQINLMHTDHVPVNRCLPPILNNLKHLLTP